VGRAALVGAAALACALGGCGDGGSGTSPPPSAPSGTTVAQTSAAGSFALLRTPAGPDDVPPPDIGTKLGSNLGVDRHAARRAFSGAAGVPTWLVPGRGWLCMVRVSPGLSTNATATSLNCQPNKLAIGGRLVASFTDLPTVPRGTSFVQGAVPDGVKSVRLRGAGGADVRAEVRDNMYAAAVVQPTALTFRLSSGRIVRLSVRR
jgi:hypothetical protein